MGEYVPKQLNINTDGTHVLTLKDLRIAVDSGKASVNSFRTTFSNVCVLISAPLSPLFPSLTNSNFKHASKFTVHVFDLQAFQLTLWPVNKDQVQTHEIIFLDPIFTRRVTCQSQTTRG